MTAASLLLPSGSNTQSPTADNRLENGPFARLKRSLDRAYDALPSRRAFGFTMAMTTMAVPTAAMACDLREGIPAEPSRDFQLTGPGVECIWFDSPVLAETMPINQNSVTRLCARDGVDKISRGFAELGAGPPSDNPGIPALNYFTSVSEDLSGLGQRLTALARTEDADYQPPKGDFWSVPLADQDERRTFPDGRARALEREVAAVSEVVTIGPELCESLQQGMERAVNADKLAWRRGSILKYDADYAQTANASYRAWQREQEQRAPRLPSP